MDRSLPPVLDHVVDIVAEDVATLKIQHETTTAELERLRADYINSLAENIKLEVDLEELRSETRTKIDSTSAELSHLRTAYDAGQVANASLKAEVEALKSSVVPRLEGDIAELKEMMRVAMARIASSPNGNREAIDDWESGISVDPFSDAGSAVGVEVEVKFT